MSLNFLRISDLLHLYLTESCCKHICISTYIICITHVHTYTYVLYVYLHILYIYVDKYFGGSTKENQEKTTQKNNLRTTVIAEIILDSIEFQILWGVEIPSLSK